MSSYRYYRLSRTIRLKVYDLILFVIFASVIFGIGYDLYNRFVLQISQTKTETEIEIDTEKIDWHDWELINKEKTQTGLGEHGEAAHLDHYPAYTQDINATVGYNGYLSDKIALNRSLKDLRPAGCITEKYSTELPTASVIIIFHNEHLSTLLRTCYSVWNRSPAVLLKEIILVDDASTMNGLSEDLSEYIDKHLPVVRLIKLDERSGLIKARIVGAEAAQGEVVVFLDSHCEAYHNWLPPLLDPIAADYRTVVCPTIDVVSSDTFAQSRQGFPSVYAGRGSFDWNFDYKLLPLLPASESQPSKPFENPVMAGGLFAMHTKFFWELGAYDSGLDTYGGEQYELSFKIWQCHGRMLENTCSRVTHIYRSRTKEVNTHLHYDFMHRNYKRVAEVWMDEYKQHIYNRQPLVYSNVDMGDISKQIALRNRLQCKPFKWFMENVAFDLLEHYPLEEPSFAYGGIRNLGINRCVDTLSSHGNAALGLYTCADNISYPHSTQSFSLTLHYDIRQRFSKRCWSKHGRTAVWLVSCKDDFRYNHQLWRYDLKHKWIINKKRGLCLDISEDENHYLVLSRCNTHNPNLKWEFGNINNTAFKLSSWYIDWDLNDEE